jgi:hypothetical protein
MKQQDIWIYLSVFIQGFPLGIQHSFLTWLPIVDQFLNQVHQDTIINLRMIGIFDQSRSRYLAECQLCGQQYAL